jgi:hypothetical protein
MELDAADVEGAVSESEDDACAAGGELEIRRQCPFVDGPGMIETDGRAIGYVGKERFVVIHDLEFSAFAVARLRQIHEQRSVELRDRLMTEADTEYRDTAGVAFEYLKHLRKLARKSGAGREDDASIVSNLVQIDVVVAHDVARAIARLAHKLREIVREGIAIIDE